MGDSASTQLNTAFIAGVVVLLGIWLKAYVDHLFEKRSIAAVAYAELAELMSQITVMAKILGIFTNAIDKDRTREMSESLDAKPGIKLDELQHTLEQLKAYVKVTRELYKEFGSKNLVQAGPATLGPLGPALAYAVRSQYARIESFTIDFYASASSVSDTKTLVEFIKGMEDFGKRLEILDTRWEQNVRPMLARATGILMIPTTSAPRS